MRCYFLRDNHIEAVHFLKPGSDEDLIQQGKVLFESAPDPALKVSRFGKASGSSTAPSANTVHLIGTHFLKCAQSLLRKCKYAHFRWWSSSGSACIGSPMPATRLRKEAQEKHEMASLVTDMLRAISLQTHRDLLKEQVRDLLTDAAQLDARADALTARP